MDRPIAKGKKTGGRDFEKGHAYCGGSRVLTPEVVAMRRMSHQQVAEIGTELLDTNFDVEKLKQIVQSGKGPLRVAFAVCILRVIAKGDIHGLNAILDRIVGRVKQEIEMTGAKGGPVLMAHLTPEDLEKRYQELKAKIKAEENVNS